MSRDEGSVGGKTCRHNLDQQLDVRLDGVEIIDDAKPKDNGRPSHEEEQAPIVLVQNREGDGER
jgi:hypothetical protein